MSAALRRAAKDAASFMKITAIEIERIPTVEVAVGHKLNQIAEALRDEAAYLEGHTAITPSIPAEDGDASTEAKPSLRRRRARKNAKAA